jgi:glycosyltransferase involved in cell wall biosynthesis
MRGLWGIMVDPKDKDALCQAMLSLLSDPNLRKKLSQKGMERAKQFSWSRCAERTVEIYKTIVKNS